MKKITAKFASKCAETGRNIKKGEGMIYDYSERKCYSQFSTVWENFGMDKESISVRDMVQANEDAYFDNFCQQNGI